MAAFNTLTPWQATSLQHYNNKIYHYQNQNQFQNVYINVSKSIHKSSLLSYHHHHPNPNPNPNPNPSPSFSSLSTRTKPNMLPTHFSTSGGGSSWLQHNSMHHDASSGSGLRFYRYYIPVFVWCEDQISQHTSKFKDGEEIPPLLVWTMDKIGFSAPQGYGKTTLVFSLDYLFRITGRKSATLSIDDFYLTAEGQAKLREENPGNAHLELRGNAGSHGLPFSVETLTALSKLTKEGMKMKLPRYDKSAYSGRDDRADPSIWPEVEGPLTVVLYEGWMLGFKPLPTEAIKAVDPLLEIVNKNLEAYYDAWDNFIKAWIVIKIQDPSCVYQWRLQAEIAMREAGKPGMSDEEVKDFVSRYLPAYKAYVPTLYSEGPNGSDPNHLLLIEIDEGRNPILDE
ncbi:hypothetical protein CRYUN_Cryun31cG0094200 [Craigia yunnanensis]